MRRFVLACSVMLLAGAAACGPGTTANPPDLITVKGYVVRGNVPVVNAAVYLTDHFHVGLAVGDASPFSMAAATFTDGSGRFYIYGVGSSYDLAVTPPGHSADVTIVTNLSRRDPTVSLGSLENAGLHNSHVTTTWNPPLPTGATVAYLLQPPVYPGVQLVGVMAVDENANDGLTAAWEGSASSNVNFWALAYERDASTGLPASYFGFTSAYGFLIDQRSNAFSLSLQTMTSSSMSLTFQPPDGYSVESADVALDVGMGSTPVDIAHFGAPSGTATFPVPDMPANRLLARSVATNGSDLSHASVLATAYPGGSADVTFTYPTSTQLTSPADGATGVDTTTAFAWNGTGINELIFSSSTPGAPSIRIVTAEQSMVLEQFPALLLTPLPPNTPYTWSARHWPDFSATDAFEAAGIDLVNANTATSGPHRFTTKSP